MEWSNILVQNFHLMYRKLLSCLGPFRPIRPKSLRPTPSRNGDCRESLSLSKAEIRHPCLSRHRRKIHSNLENFDSLVAVILLVAFFVIPRGPKYGQAKKVVANDKVYDITSYVEEHPGGDAIFDQAGDDSTQGFFGPQHATRVFDMIDDFYIGDLVL